MWRGIIGILLVLIIATSILFGILNIHNIYGQAPFIIKEKIGEWEEVNPVEVVSGMNSGESRVILEYRNMVLGGWFSNIDIDLTGSEGDIVVGEFSVIIPELNIEIRYFEERRIGGFLGSGGYVNSNLRVIINGGTRYELSDYTVWPLVNRLDTRIYFGIWRISEDRIILNIEDYYGDLGNNLSIYYRVELDYDGSEVTLLMEISKDSDKPSRIRAFLYFNEVVEGEVFDEGAIRKLNIDTGILFYTSLGILIIAIIVNFMSRAYTVKARIPREGGKALRMTRRGRPSSR